MKIKNRYRSIEKRLGNEKSEKLFRIEKPYMINRILQYEEKIRKEFKEDFKLVDTVLYSDPDAVKKISVSEDGSFLNINSKKLFHVDQSISQNLNIKRNMALREFR